MQTKQNGGTPELVDLQLLAREREGKCRTVRDDCHEAGNSSQISEQTNFRPGDALYLRSAAPRGRHPDR